MQETELRHTKNGQGVFALRPFETGETVMSFTGRRFTKAQLPQPYEEVDDHFVQIGQDLYMGPSGGSDDFVNHSCDPNAGLVVTDDGVRLVAIRPIGSGEEITWDYSTTMDEDEWEMTCRCGAENCRGEVRDFRHLPSYVRKKYLTLGVVPGWIRENNYGNMRCKTIDMGESIAVLIPESILEAYDLKIGDMVDIKISNQV